MIVTELYGYGYSGKMIQMLNKLYTVQHGYRSYCTTQNNFDQSTVLYCMFIQSRRIV